MLDERLVIVGSIIAFIFGSLNYFFETLKGKTKPNKITWFIWALAPLVAFAAQIGKGVGLASFMTFVNGFGPLLIFLASFVNRKAYWKLQKSDYLCGGLAIFGLILWWFTGEGNWAIIFAILADALAGLPTIIKSYHHPETESSQLFLIMSLNAVLTLLTIKVWDFAHYAFPVYIFTICSLLYVLIRFRIGAYFGTKRS